MARLLCFAVVITSCASESQQLAQPSSMPHANASNVTSQATPATSETYEASAVRGLRGFRKNVTASRLSRQLHGQNQGRWPDQGWGDRFDAWGWGNHHGVTGETCCMCSRRGRRGRTILFAGGDYDHYYGARSAHQQCDRVCELQCALQNGHKFGCYEEDDLRRITRRYSGQRNFVIRHQKWYGNIC